MVLVKRFLGRASLSHSSTPQTAIPRSRFAIAPPQLPNSDRTPPTSQTAIAPPQLPKQRSHSLTPQTAIASPQTSQIAIAPLQLPKSDRTPSTPKQRFLGRASLSHPSNFPNNDSCGALRYRTSSTSQKRFLGRASLSHPLNPPKQRTDKSARALSHPLNFPNISFLTSDEESDLWKFRI